MPRNADFIKNNTDLVNMVSELADDKKSAAIIVDDLSRPTPAYQVIPFVLRELSAAGIPKSEIRFVVGVGGHRPISEEDLNQDGQD